MRGVDDGHACARNIRADQLARRDRRRHVVTAGDHQRWALDLRQQRALVERRQRLAAGEVAFDGGGEQHRLHPRGDVRLALAEVLRQPSRDHGIGDRGDAALLHGVDALQPFGRLGIVAGGIGEDELAEALRRVGAQPLPDHAAHRQAAPMHLLDVEVVEDREHVAAEALHGVGAGRNV
ncbi:hypothetical protein ABIF83_003336 [Bradyrhizobium ottawaense]